MQIEEYCQRLQAVGALPCHIERVLRAWVQVTSVDNRHSKAEHFLPKSVRALLPELQADWAGLASVQAEHPGGDGSARLLVKLADGQTVESVLLPRDGLCVSTQVGCAVGCVFCMTGKSGLLRQLSSGEIVAQVVLARQRRPVKRVVFMGMGEPAHNLDNVLAAIDVLGRLGNIGHKQLVFSTVGDRRVFERLPQGAVQPALAISLHSTLPERRAALLPKAARIDPEELVELGEAYARATRYPIQYQWTLMQGVNDSAEEIEGIIRLLRGKYAMMNMIPWNSVDDLGFVRPERPQAVAISARLNEAGILTKLRNSAGQDIDGGCGQLRARHAAPLRRAADQKDSG